MSSSRRLVVVLVALVSVAAGTLLAFRLRRPPKLKIYAITTSHPAPPAREASRDPPELRLRIDPPPPAFPVPPATAAPIATNQEPSDGSGPAKSRDRLIDRIVSSGPASGKWPGRATKLFGSLRQLLPADLAAKVAFTKTACYRQACVLEAVCDDSASYDSLNQLLLESDTLKSWAGPKGRTAAEMGDGGRMTVSWFLMNPADEASN